MLIQRFYTAFQNKDHKTMQDCYSDNATFSDAVFSNLNAQEVRAMWEMLLKTGTDLRVEFTNVQADQTTGSAEWTAWYSFSKTGNRVVNRIRARFTFENGKILEHRDSFDFPAWARQALGFSGWLLGRTKYLRNKVQQTAKSNLEKFMKQRHEKATSSH